jgi:hypothetical protein
MRLVEESSGVGELCQNETLLGRVPYRISRFQEFNERSGLPIPGMHRIEGAVDLGREIDAQNWIGIALKLRLENGSVLGVTLVDATGRILSEGHGPSRCLCC